MLYCVILHKMAKNEKRPLVELREGEVSGSVRVSAYIEQCFECVDFDRSQTFPGTVAAMCEAERYLTSIIEYANTRRLIIKNMIMERDK